MSGQAATWVAALACVLVLLVLWWPWSGPRPARGDARRKGRPRRRTPGREGGPDPLEDDVAAEALGQAVALLQAGVSATDLFRVWGSTRAADALAGTGSRVWLGEDGEPSALTRRGRQRVREAAVRQRWVRALAAADLQVRSGGDLVRVDGPGRAWEESMWAVGLATGTGAPLAEFLERVRDECTARADAARARTAGLAAARTTRRILMSLPAGGLLLAQALGADPLNILLDTFWGRAAAAIGLVFWAVAALWSRRIMRAGESS